MLIEEFIGKFEGVYPRELQADWDNSGIQLGDSREELRGILTCLDLTEEVIDEAIRLDCNFILAHHPILFEAKKTLNYKNFITRKLVKAVKNDIFIYASHTSIDAHSKGLNSYVFKALGFESEGRLEEREDGHGYGDYGIIEPIRACDLADEIKERLGINQLIFYGDPDRLVKKLALATGAGEDFIGVCLDKGIDLYITADIKHHAAMDSLEQDLMLMDISHYHSEKLFNNLCKQTIESICPEVRVYTESRGDKYDRKIL